MKKPLALLLFLLCTLPLLASHIVGGEAFYTYLGPGSAAGTSRYRISLRLFRDCDVPCGEGTNVACLPTVALMSVFQGAAPYKLMNSFSLPIKDTQAISLTKYPICIFSKPDVCYEIKTYTQEITLPDNADGYMIAYQNCCRASSVNVYGNANTLSGQPGATYTAVIPGRNILPSGYNTSAVCKIKDTALVCIDGKVSIDFGATDADGDSLSYAFAGAYDGGDFMSAGCTWTTNNTTGCAVEEPAGPPPYKSVLYNPFYSYTGTSPLGGAAVINPVTGLISGTAPSIGGLYVVNVEITEWRKQKIVATHRKDFIVHVEDCKIPRARLEPSYINCNQFSLTFENQATSPLIESYYWDFGQPATTTDTSTTAAPTYTYSDTGSYTVTLITNKGRECSDTATTVAKVYPGFEPDFTTSSGCVVLPVTFTDQTLSQSGTVNFWRWDFGDGSTSADTAITQNPSYTYSTPMPVSVRLIAGNTKGCLDTVTKTVVLFDKPPLQLPFRDTIICKGDSLQLQVSANATGTPTYTWSPTGRINNASTAQPTVYPNTGTLYRVAVNDNGCINTDSVRVNVVDHITLELGPDTTICLTDGVQLFPVTDGLKFTWSPAASLSSDTARNPIATPLANTRYTLQARVGSCKASDAVTINVVPYPKVTASADTAICTSTTAMLSAQTDASSFTWSPTSTLSQANTLHPVAAPRRTTAYVITVSDVRGCPKPVRDTVVVTVQPPVPAFAGNDTAIIVNQPLQLQASGGVFYSWSPATGLSDPNIANPVVLLGSGYDSITYRVTVRTDIGCVATDDIKVIVFKSQPDIFVPSAFTPNSDGKNDLLQPTVVGIKQFNYFRIYNRWGQLIFYTTKPNQGWDGRLSGQLQPIGTYVYVTQGIDYTGKTLLRKGTFVLIR